MSERQPWYGMQRWRRIARRQLREHPLCALCLQQGKVVPASVADHVKPHRGDQASFWAGALQSLCEPHHNVTKQREEIQSYPDLARPELPKPSCRVMLICGPPASGKSTYVHMHKNGDDIVIDLDLIAQERGFTRDRPQGEIASLLQERNKRLAALAHAPRARVAWVILTAPSHSLRAWWCAALGVKQGDLIVCIPSKAELYRRIKADPGRVTVASLHMALVDQWLMRERDDDAGTLKRGVDADGYPTDPLHPWNRADYST